MDAEVDKGKMPGGSTYVLDCRSGRLAFLHMFWVAAADGWRLFVCSGPAGKIAGGSPRLF